MNRYEAKPVLPEPRSGRVGLSWAISVPAAVLAMCGALFAFQQVADRLHDPHIDYLSERVEYLRGNASPGDVLFVGTSVIHRNVDTGRLNELGAAEGCDLDFYNLGLPAMSVGEFHLLLDLMVDSGARPRFLVFNPALYDGLSGLGTRRASWANRLGAVPVSWASLGARRTTARLTGRLEVRGEGLQPRLVFARHWLLSSLRTGEAAQWVLRDRPGPNSRAIRRLHRQNGGFLALEDDPNVKPERRAGFLGEVEEWRTRGEATRDSALSYYARGEPDPLPAADRRLQQRLIALAQTTGAQPMALFPPQIAYQPRLAEEYRGALGDENVLDFGFHRHPEFLDDGLWYDRAHLNRQGSRLLSDMLYTHFCGPR